MTGTGITTAARDGEIEGPECREQGGRTETHGALPAFHDLGMHFAGSGIAQSTAIRCGRKSSAIIVALDREIFP